MLHHVAADSYRTVFNLVSSPLTLIPADGDPLLKWLRNQMLAFNYLLLYISSAWIFFFAQLFYNDGKLFITFWQQMITDQPFV